MLKAIWCGMLCLVIGVMAAGCTTTDSNPCEDYTIVVVKDQSILLEGSSITVDQFVDKIKADASGGTVTLRVYPQSKIKPETLQSIVAKLEEDGYTTTIVPVPEKQ